MKKFFAVFCICMISTVLFSDISKCEKTSLKNFFSKSLFYQDIFFEGEVITDQRVCNCSDRYQLISKFCRSLPNEFSVLDLGGAQGYFSFRLTNDFNASALVIDSNPNFEPLMKKLIKINNNYGCDVTFKCDQLNQNYLENLKNADFDVVIATNIVHHIPGGQKKAIYTIHQLGKYVFIEIPKENNQSIIDYAKKLGGESVGHFFRRVNNTLPSEMLLFSN